MYRFFVDGGFLSLNCGAIAFYANKQELIDLYLQDCVTNDRELSF